MMKIKMNIYNSGRGLVVKIKHYKVLVGSRVDRSIAYRLVHTNWTPYGPT